MKPSTAETLKAAWALIDTPEHWTQGAWARKANGYPIGGEWDKAVSYDSSGALRKVTGGLHVLDEREAFRDAYDELCNACRFLYGENRITLINDTHSHSDIAAVWALAIRNSTPVISTEGTTACSPFSQLFSQNQP